MRVLAHVPDLMDRSRVLVVGDRSAATVEFVADPARLVTEALASDNSAPVDLVLVDLARPGVVDVLASVLTRTIGFAAHVDEALIDAAHIAGCDEVLARSVFFRRLPELLEATGADS